MAVEGEKRARRRGAHRDPFKLARFVEEMSRPGVTQREAVLAAGYAVSPASAEVRGSRLMRDPGIRARVEARRRELLDGAGDEGRVFLVHAPGPRLYRLCFAPSDSVGTAFDRLRAESPVPLVLVWELKGLRRTLADLCAALEGRLHHGAWYRLSESDLNRLAGAVETCSPASLDAV